MEAPPPPPPHVQDAYPHYPYTQQDPATQLDLLRNLFAQSPFVQNHPSHSADLGGGALLLQNPLLLPSLLLLLVDSKPPAVANWTTTMVEDDQFQTRLLASNLDQINHINQKLQRALHNRRPTGGADEADDPKKCSSSSRRRSGFYLLLESSLGVQEAAVRRRLRGQTSGGVTGAVLEAMLRELGRHKANLQVLRGRLLDTLGYHPHRHLGGCVQPFFAYGGQCFYLSHEVKLSWHDAKAACEGMEAQLARPRYIRGLANFLLTLPGDYQRCWIGGSDGEAEGEWKWLSGEAVGRGEWRAGQPSNYSRQGEEQDCLALVRPRRRRTNSRGDDDDDDHPPSLDDYACDRRRAFLCQRVLKC